MIPESDENEPQPPDGFMWYNIKLFPLKSAFKHGVSEEDMCYAVRHPRFITPLREEPLKELYLGFDTVGRPLEVIVDDLPPGKAIIHAMPMRKKYILYLAKGGRK
ncbi:toxin [Bifidobacterium sp. ESL0728]|uniref:toxin n=1 Tax=Bifidobacterium sp. ESL0728 TaxID=2983220 RepID=UPI0023F64386|nr:toxin [Bifidobacterium sp. ESL0728]WEV59132.1 toxin [Bifidobacterium sp. ESL0728]